MATGIKTSKILSRIFTQPQFGVGFLSVIPMRAIPSHKSEMVSQLLFAETFEILRKEENWYKIKCSYDGYKGWVSESDVMPIDERNFIKINTSSVSYITEIVIKVQSVYKERMLLFGSPLPFFNNKEFSFFDDKYLIDGSVIDLTKTEPNAELIVKLAMKFLDVPYLWGGRSPFGIDCSGFVQIIYKLSNIRLPRDASMQADGGELITDIGKVKTGDLAFFVNEKGNISHVGLLLNNSQIIHASGRVRIDSFDKDGIYHDRLQKYTHKLYSIKRFF